MHRESEKGKGLAELLREWKRGLNQQGEERQRESVFLEQLLGARWCRWFSMVSFHGTGAIF